MSQPMFSVVIPTYNRADLIAITIKSVLQQSYEDFEVLVVDDGSTDNTREVVLSINDPRLMYHPKRNEERAVARNAGARISKGRYLTFLDSDDRVYEHHLSTAVDVVERYCEPEFFHLGFETEDAATGAVSRRAELPEVANERLITGNLLSCNGVFLRRDIAEKYPFNPTRDLSGTEDYELWLRLASRYPLYCERRITSVVMQHDGRSVVTADRAKLEKRIDFLERFVMADEAFMERFGNQIGLFRANNRLYIALHLALAKSDRSGAVGYLVKALANSPRALQSRSFYGTLKRLFL